MSSTFVLFWRSVYVMKMLLFSATNTSTVENDSSVNVKVINMKVIGEEKVTGAKTFSFSYSV